jgi:hypothetical protein
MFAPWRGHAGMIRGYVVSAFARKASLSAIRGARPTTVHMQFAATGKGSRAQRQKTCAFVLDAEAPIGASKSVAKTQRFCNVFGP